MTANYAAFDFSIPIMEAGLQIVVLSNGEAHRPGPLLDMFRLLFSITTLKWLGMALLLVMVPAHLGLVVRTTKEGAARSQSVESC